MSLTTGQIHDLYIALSMLDREEMLKFVPDVRLKIAININLVRPLAEAYERTRTRITADLNSANRVLAKDAQRTDAELQADFLDQNEALRIKPQDIELKMLLRPDLKLDENTKIGGVTLARLMPIIEGLELNQPETKAA